MPPGRRPQRPRRRPTGGGLGSSFLSNQASDEARRISNYPRLPPPSMGNQQMEDPIALWQRTLAEQGAIQNYPGGDGGGGRRRGGGGGGGGGGGQADYAAILAAIGQPYDLATRQTQDRAEGGRRRAATENAALNTSIAGQNKASTAAIQQRAMLLRQILAEAQQRQQNFNQIAQTDLAGQGISSGGYNQVAQIEANRLAGQAGAQQQLGGDLDALIREAMTARQSYAAQSQRDALAGISEAESRALQAIALQRAQEEAKIRAEAAAAGRKI